jgi:metacaspase-1
MKKLMLFSFLIVLLENPVFAFNKYAFLVGVGRYPMANGWQTLKADDDVALTKTALLQQGFDAQKITTLTNEEATKAAIMGTFKRLAMQLQKGDIVVFLFSGHGQRIADKNGDETDGYDESIVPYDAPALYEKGRNEGGRHIIDDELWAVFTDWQCRIGATGQVLTLFDACFAGTATRSATNWLDKHPLSILASEAHIQQYLDKSEANFQEQTAVAPTCKSADLAPMISFFATSPDERSRQIQDENGRAFGPLCFAFARSLSLLKQGAAYGVLFEKIKQVMSVFSPNQTPTTAGDLAKNAVFGGQLIASKRHYSVVGNPTATDVVSINIGWLAGIGEGSIIAFYPEKTEDTTGVKPLALGEIVEVNTQTAKVRLKNALKTPQILRGSKVYIQQWARRNNAIKLRLETPHMIVQEHLRERVVLTTGSDWGISLKFEKNIDSFDAVLTLPTDVIFAKFKAYSWGEIAEKTQCHLLAYEQAQFLRTLELEEDDLTVRLEMLPVVKDVIQKQAKTIFKLGEEFVFRLTNLSPVSVFVNIIDIMPTNRMTVFAPQNGVIQLAPNGSFTFDKDTQGIGEPIGNEVLKVIVTPYAIDFSTLDMFQNPENACILRGSTRAAKNDFERLFMSFQSVNPTRSMSFKPDVATVQTVCFKIEK